ncbi:hypothetical protein FisN_4Hh486 [Fistulifera solaris]|jgi:nucleolar MIF4G domain-containing protein 1|uniref:MI domain-containing protein n=1 Tax=Fistulifera solaris TaxID=1519565 RepID=A0A1Z5KJ86_FISSO|nr:hypothetical protein FisN_4Hh486 [Fistulifera solaris]|eukprot:GAX26018.1 hypothetical protein FisN_4Hh486 [Fistulifera solaris]
MPTQVELRKARRKEQRSKKRQVRRPAVSEQTQDENAVPSLNEKEAKSNDRKRKEAEIEQGERKPKRSKVRKSDPYAHLDDATADALRRDDEEIATLHRKLGLSKRKGKDLLKKEFATQEGYGDDFASFLDDIDGMIDRVTRPSQSGNNEDDTQSSSGGENDERAEESNESEDMDDSGDDNDEEDEAAEESLDDGSINEDDEDYEDIEETLTTEATREKSDQAKLNWDESIVAALRRDDEEIKELEAKLGLKGSRDKKKLSKEYAKEEGYGEDFGDFLDDLDNLVNRVTGKSMESLEDSVAEDEYHGSSADESDSDQDAKDDHRSQYEDGNASLDSRDDSSQTIESESDNVEDDHDVQHTYKPTEGEDIYGKKIQTQLGDAAPRKYVPPHMRKAEASLDSENDKKRQENLQAIQRSLNHVLNKLSSDSVISVAQAIARLYPSYPTSDVNECIWTNAKSACISRVHLMTGLIPEYVAALAGVQAIQGDTSQLGAFLMEKVVIEMWEELKVSRESTGSTSVGDDNDLLAKQGSNMTIFLCYMYNFGIIHCSLVYDIIRDFLESFKEIDIELLLLILRHSGRALRSDDPSALKDIVLLVQKRALEGAANSKNAARVDYMVTAIMDLKNNKKRNQQDAALVEKTARLRKVIGQVKAGAKGAAFASGSTLLRVSLADILNIETKGRYWKVGASWAGNQFSYNDEQPGDNAERAVSISKAESSFQSEEEEKLLKLAEKYRMNSDVRRSIFCIIMGSADCDDSFEKLVRANLLKNKTERETVRVLLECCAKEKSFNKYYSHLAARICEFQMQCKFSFQLAFWDAFKTFNDCDARKAANLAKLLFHLVVTHRHLKLNVLKAIDMASPEDLSEKAAIFLAVFFSDLMEYYENPSEVIELFENGVGRTRKNKDESEEMGHMDEGEALRASFTVFFVQVLKASPKNQKGSRFRTNLKAAIKACDTENFY